MKVISVEPTPNPNAFKFVLDKRIVDSGVRNYGKAEDAAGDPLARRIFAIPDVDSVFFCDNFVTVSMLPTADWRAVHDRVVDLLDAQAGLAAGDGAARGAGEAAGAAAPAQTDDPELLDKVNALLDDRVRPALAGDGGGLEILALRGKTLHIRYQGACGSCPSSISGTLDAIQNLVQTEIDAELQVVSA